MKCLRQGEKPYSTFVRQYMEGYYAGESAAEIAKRLDTTEGALLVYACDLRKKGVRIPKLNDRLDVDHLNGIIRRAAKSWAQ
jgi:hypothetical protein